MALGALEGWGWQSRRNVVTTLDESRCGWASLCMPTRPCTAMTGRGSSGGVALGPGARWRSRGSGASTMAGTSIRRRRAPPSPSLRLDWCVGSSRCSLQRGFTSPRSTAATHPTPACGPASPNRLRLRNQRRCPARHRRRRFQRLRNRRGRGSTGPSFTSAPSAPTCCAAPVAQGAPSGASIPPASKPKPASAPTHLGRNGHADPRDAGVRGQARRAAGAPHGPPGCGCASPVMPHRRHSADKRSPRKPKANGFSLFSFS